MIYKRKIDKLDFIKIKTSCSLVNTFEKNNQTKH